MKFSRNWLEEYVDLKDYSSQELADRITLSLSEVESIEKHGTDDVFEIENKGITHRPDCFSYLGIARELSAYFNLPLKDPTATYLSYDIPKPTRPVSIEIINDPSLCDRILAIVLEIDSVGTSPQEIKDRLEASDVRSLNTVIDITNYVMLEVGHPTHAFDFDRIQTGKLIIRPAKKGEKMVTLEKKEYTLTGGEAVIDDGTGRIVDLPGIMGTDNSVITDKTKRVLFFIECNNKAQIRKTSKTHGIRSVASTINEKGPGHALAYTAFKRGIALFEKHVGAKPVSDPIDIYPRPEKTHQVVVDAAWISQFLGMKLSEKQMMQHLQNLGFAPQIDGGTITITAPSWRQDIHNQADIAEEIGRIHGYDKIPITLPTASDTPAPANPSIVGRRSISQALIGMGFSELYLSPFVGDTQLSQTGLAEIRHLELQNPLTEDQGYMRRSLFPSLLSAATRNMHRYATQRIFEIGKLFVPQEGTMPLEPVYLSGLAIGDSYRIVKGYVESLFAQLHVSDVSYAPYPQDCSIYDALFHPQQTAQIYIGKKPMGIIGAIHPSVAHNYGITDPMFGFEMHVDTVIEHATTFIPYIPIPTHPPILEDVTIKLAKDVLIGDTINQVHNISNLITKVELIDTYKDTITLRLTFQHATRNLTEKEVGEIKNKIVK